MKTLRLMMSALSILAVAACGPSDVSDAPSDEYGYEPEATPDATPEPTAIPNIRPDVPAFTLSSTAVKALDEVQVELALYDADGDALTTICSAAVVSQTPELELPDALVKISETEWTFTAPITAAEIGLAVIRCQAIDARGAVSDLAESMTIEIDNYVDVDPVDPGNKRDVCFSLLANCTIDLDVSDLMLHVRVFDAPQYVPDQFRGAFVDLPHTDFVAGVDIAADTTALKHSFLDENIPSIQFTVGTDADGSGYALELLPYVSSGSTFSTMRLQWTWQVRALAVDGMTKPNLLAGTVLASGYLGFAAPNHVEATVQDGLLQFSINGNVFTPAIAATNLAGTQVGFSARAADVQFAGAHAVLKP